LSTKVNHHFVPKYVFRLHNGGAENIHLVRKATGDVIWDASIRGQCARHKYYGSKEFEDWLEGMDSKHAAAFQRVVKDAWEAPKDWPLEEYVSLREAVMLQRARVPRTVDSNAASMNEMSMYIFKEFAKQLPDKKIRDGTLQAIEDEEVKFDGIEFESLMMAMHMAIPATAGIFDLQGAVMRNLTDYPFIFGDCPCVFYNRLLFDWTDRGVLGVRSPGLMIVYPIHPKTLLMLYDGNAYSIKGHDAFVDIREMADVSQLNALQVHSSMTNLYFYQKERVEYVCDLVRAHRVSSNEPLGAFKVHKPGGLIVDGLPSEHEAIHIFERQIPHRLELTCLEMRQTPDSTTLGNSRGGELDLVMRDWFSEPDGE
jgi:hypothetical protein